MTKTTPVSLEDILDQFALEHPTPTSQALTRYAQRFPDHRDAIVEFATTSIEQTLLPAAHRLQVGWEKEFVDAASARFEMAAARRDVDRRTKSAAAVGPSTSMSPPTLYQLAQRAGITLLDLGPRLELDIGLIAKLDKRLILAETIPVRLVRELANLLSSSVEAILDTLRAPPAVMPSPAFMIIRSAALPTPEAFADAVRSSTLSETTKARWLSEMV